MTSNRVPPAGRMVFAGPSPRGSHRLSLAAECLQKYAWTYEAPVPAEGSEGPQAQSPALCRGQLVHLGMAQHYAAKGFPGTHYASYADAIDFIGNETGMGAYVKECTETVRLTILASQEADLGYRPIGVEQLFDVRVRGHRLTGRVDLIFEDSQGRVWGVDHKTSGRINKATEQYYTLSMQFQAYAYMLRQAYGDRFAGFMLNLIQVGPKFKFDRVILPRSPWLETSFPYSVEYLEKQIATLQASGIDYASWPKAMTEHTCYTRYGPCRFRDKCRFGPNAATAGAWEWSD